MSKHDPSPDALAIAAEWWRVEEMRRCGVQYIDLTRNSIGPWRMGMYWRSDGKGHTASGDGPTPAAAIIAAHEAWQKEQGK